MCIVRNSHSFERWHMAGNCPQGPGPAGLLSWNLRCTCKLTLDLQGTCFSGQSRDCAVLAEASESIQLLKAERSKTQTVGAWSAWSCIHV